MKRTLQELLHARESSTLDFKRQINLRSYEEKEEFAKDVSAFANTKGGHIVFGKEDPEEGGRNIGIDPKTFNSAQMHQIVSKRCYPPVNFDTRIEEYESKNFVVITIPESKIKLHEIKESRSVYVRRGDTTDKATQREISNMINKSQDKENELDNYEDGATIAGLLSLLVMSYFPLKLLTFWKSGKGLAIAYWLSSELILIPIVVIICFIVLICIFGSSIKIPILKHLRKISLYYILTFGIFISVIIILNTLLFLYPNSTRIFFHHIWVEFLQVCCLGFVITSITIIICYFPNVQFFSRISNPQYKKDVSKDVKKFIQEVKQIVKQFKKRTVILIISAILLVPLVIVPTDTKIGLFIPQLQESPESLSEDYYASNKVYLFIYSERVSSDKIVTKTKFYRLFQKPYIIQPAKFPLLNEIRIPNPTNNNIGSKEEPRLDPISSKTHTDNIGAVHVAINESTGVSYNFVPVEYNFSFVDFNFEKNSEPITANVTYWKLVEDVDIDVITSHPSYIDLGNGSWLEKYTYLIENNENITLEILALDFDRFLFASIVDTSTTKVYSQGGERYTNFVYENRRLGLNLNIGSLVQLNLTITIQSNDIT